MACQKADADDALAVVSLAPAKAVQCDRDEKSGRAVSSLWKSG